MPPEDSLELFPESSPAAIDPAAPLADRMRPRGLDEVVGQTRLLARGAPLRELFESGELPSLILWGPPGTGKTTLARILGGRPGCRFEALSAVMAGVKDIAPAFDVQLGFVEFVK